MNTEDIDYKQMYEEVQKIAWEQQEEIENLKVENERLNAVLAQIEQNKCKAT